jgi:hypothetical protein
MLESREDARNGFRSPFEEDDESRFNSNDIITPLRSRVHSSFEAWVKLRLI